MAPHASSKPQIQRLIDQAEHARQHLDQDVARLRHRLDFPQRLRASVQQHPRAWWLGSLLAGLLASRLTRQKKSPHPVVTFPAANSAMVRRAWPLTLLGLAWTATRPIASQWLRRRLSDWIHQRMPAATPTISRFTRPPTDDSF